MGEKTDERGDASVRSPAQYRVGAILSSQGSTVQFLGWGVLEGREVPDPSLGYLAYLLHSAGRSNPKIRLDNGKTVWGFECWWGREAEIQAFLKDRTVVSVDIDEVRTAAARTSAEARE